MNLTEEPVIVEWPETHYVFVEMAGPFDQTAQQSWQRLHRSAPALAAHNTITGFTSLFRMRPPVYRAGATLAAAAVELPEGLEYVLFAGGRYSKFVYTGPYPGLHQAYKRVTEIIAERSMQLRDDYNIENYLNDPKTTPEDQLITEILYPAQ